MKNFDKLKENQTPTFDTNIPWDILVEEIVVKNHKKNWIYCDVGSSVGLFTNLFKMLSPDGQVYAFDLINSNLDGCVFENVAISDKDGIESVYDAGSHMSNILGHDVLYNSSPFIKEIKSIRLDTYFLDKNVDCLKIDIEGAELSAIRGGIETIKKCSLVIIECHLDEHWLDIYNILSDNNLIFYDLSNHTKITKENRPYQIYKLKNN
jgi:FkbM family methyltransferase